MLKKQLLQEGPYELEINKLFSTEPLSSNPRNHCVHLLDIIELPDDPPIIVHPLLRPFYKPPFQTYGEFVTFFAQICEASPFSPLITYIRRTSYNRVSNSCTKTTLLTGKSSPFAPIFVSDMTYIRDCTYQNIMLDPSNMFPESFHPAAIERSKDFRRKAKWYSRTRRPTKYLLIDFGLSRRYDPANGPPLDTPLRGGDKSAPEHQDRVTPCNPFPTDVYYLGNLVREYYILVCAFASPHDLPR